MCGGTGTRWDDEYSLAMPTLNTPHPSPTGPKKNKGIEMITIPHQLFLPGLPIPTYTLLTQGAKNSTKAGLPFPT